MQKKLRLKNGIAKALYTPLYKMRVIPNKKKKSLEQERFGDWKDR